MNILDENTPRMVLFPKGTILWRSVHFSPDGVTLDEPVFEKTPSGALMARCLLNGNYCNEPEVYEGGSGNVVFIDKAPTNNWTHLIVTGVSKAMKAPPAARGAGCAIFATPAVPYYLESYLEFRRLMFNAMLENRDATYEAKLAYTLEIWPTDRRPGDRRLVYSDGCYDHIVIESETVAA